jgi:hypothetical protein
MRRSYSFCGICSVSAILLIFLTAGPELRAELPPPPDPGEMPEVCDIPEAVEFDAEMMEADASVSTAPEIPSLLGDSIAFIIPPPKSGSQWLWEKWTKDEKTEYLTQTSRILSNLGAKIVKFSPELNLAVFSWDTVEPKLMEYDFTWADIVTGILKKSGLEPVIMMSSYNHRDHESTTMLPVNIKGYYDYIEMMVDRYDGDTDFYFTSGDNYPDINGSGTVNTADWEADKEEKLKWADDHRVLFFEIERDPFLLKEKYNISETEYGQLLLMTYDKIKEFNENAQVLTAAINLKNRTKNAFLSVFSAIKKTDKGHLDIAQVILEGGESDFLGNEILVNAKNFKAWMKDLGYDKEKFWISGFQLGALPGTGEFGKCKDSRCSEQTQAEQIVKVITGSLALGYEKILYGQTVEITYEGKNYPFEHTGIMKRAFEDLTSEIQVRGAYAVFSFLQEKLSGISPDDISEVLNPPANTRIFKIINEDGIRYLMWYDWITEVPSGSDYGDKIKIISLTDIPYESVNIYELWPESYDSKLHPSDFSASFEFKMENRKISDSTLEIKLKRAPVLIMKHETMVSDDSVNDVQETIPSDNTVEIVEKDKSGGCIAGWTIAPTAYHGLLIIMFLLLIVRPFRGR